MMKEYKLSIKYDDVSDEIDSLSEILEEVGAEAVWLETADGTVLLPPELAKYLEETGILGIA